jgi:hypothetical protein
MANSPVQLQSHPSNSTVTVAPALEASALVVHDQPMVAAVAPLAPVLRSSPPHVTGAVSSTAIVPAASPEASVSSTLLSIATPMSSLAGSAFRLCYRAVRGGVRRALQLRSDWTEGQVARRKVAALMRARAEDRLRARRREEQAMKQLQELEAQIQHMQQSD